MEKIAFKRMGSWLSASWDDVLGALGMMLMFGLGWIVAFIVTFVAGQIVGQQSFMGIAFGQIFGQLAYSIPVAGLAGAALARAHGRIPTWGDYFQDSSTFLQAVLAAFLGSLAVVFAVAVLAAPGLFLAQGSSVIGAFLGWVWILCVIVPSFFLLYPLVLFSVPLTIDKRLDCWSALKTSYDCGRRDVAGLAVFALVITVILMLGFCVCCGVVFTGPLIACATMRCYESYFGLDPDRMAPPPANLEPWEPLASPYLQPPEPPPPPRVTTHEDAPPPP